MDNYAIIVVGYNRAKETERLLHSINNADYEGDKVTLIISIDNSGNDKVYEMANNFHWMHGEKVIRKMPVRMGLRKHILSCGDYLNEYDAVAILEDDLVVAPDFYRYMKQAVSFYKDNDNIAGISLYSHLWNVCASYPFQPEEKGPDAYFMQYAQSWGQVWMKCQWHKFKEWYEKNDADFSYAEGVPAFVCRWRNSWLKYHIRYLVETDKYFVYPYRSLTTCFAEEGEHALYKTTTFQVPLFNGKKERYAFPMLEEANVCYDSYFERILTDDVAGIDKDDICVDLYGNKSDKIHMKYRYLLTIKKLPMKIVKSYALDLRPWELNVIWGLEGEDIFLYDSEEPLKVKTKQNKQQLKVWHYYARAFVKKKLILKAFVDYSLMKVRNVIKR